MDLEFLLLNTLARALPPIPGCGRIANGLRAVYARKPRALMTAKRDGLRLHLDPSECVDGSFLFYPQLYDRKEMELLAAVLSPGDTFLDIGANIGLYSLKAARLVGAQGRVISIEPDPYSFERLSLHRTLNGFTWIEPLQVGVADREDSFSLSMSERGNRGGSTMLSAGGDGVTVRCRPLLSILRDSGVQQIKLMKIDIEGFEFKVLKEFFASAERTIWPRFIILEYQQKLDSVAGGSSLELAKSCGYRHIHTWSGINAVLELGT